MRLSALLVVTMFLAILLLKPDSLRVQAAEQDSVTRILSDWSQQRKAIQTMRWELEGKVIIPKGSYSDESTAETIPSDDVEYQKKTIWIIDLPGNRVRKEARGMELYRESGEFRPTHTIEIFNGVNTKRHLPRKTNAEEFFPQGAMSSELGIVENGNTLRYELTDLPVYYSLGIFSPSSTISEPLGPTQLRPELKHEQIVHQEKRVLQNKPVTLIRLVAAKNRDNHFDELWVDTSPPLRVLRVDNYFDRQIATRTDINYESEKEFPSGWRTTYYKAGMLNNVKPGLPRVYRIEQYVVKQILTNPRLDDAEFDIPLRPGMVVRKANVNAGLDKDYETGDYQVAQDGETLVPVTFQTPKRVWPRYLPIVLVILGLIIMIFTILRLRGQNKSKDVA